MAVLTIYVGAKDATQLVAARGANVFGPFFSTIFANGIEVEDETVRKMEVYGIAQMLLNEPLFYQPPLNAAAQGLIAMMRALMRDVNRNGFAGNYLETNVEYDAYHKLSLANIGVVDPIPQVTDLSGLLRQTVSCAMQWAEWRAFSRPCRPRIESTCRISLHRFDVFVNKNPKRLIFSRFPVVAVVQHAAVAQVVEQLELAAFRTDDDGRLSLQVFRSPSLTTLLDRRLELIKPRSKPTRFLGAANCRKDSWSHLARSPCPRSSL